MSEYVEVVSGEVIRVLRHAVGLPRHRFAGYAANLAFWVDEALHALAVVEGYPERFERLERAVKRVSSSNPSSTSLGAEGEFEPRAVRPNAPVRSTLDAQRRWEIAEDLASVLRAFIARCKREGEGDVSSIADRLRGTKFET